MCQDRNSQRVRVKVPADLSCDGHEKWKDVAIDACIAPKRIAACPECGASIATATMVQTLKPMRTEAMPRVIGRHAEPGHEVVTVDVPDALNHYVVCR